MSIRPIDFRVMIPKTQQQSEENQTKFNQLKTEHELLAQQDKKSVEHQLKKVNESESKDQPHIKNNQEKKKEKNNSDFNQKKKKQDKEEKREKDIKGQRIGQNIDIKI
ncbi:hypothetical protein [Inediibacterium massiliense]|uniref:hypothetical protein n=1 Tax=Inediibacterium massiliense TaxID=1658111 RepID=UPI0006B67F65|nr:hypothetical protein [Inediibacterium massiliense]